MPKRSTFLLALALGALAFTPTRPARAQGIPLPLAVRGFNEDVVANGTGPASTSTTADMDGGGVNTRFAFVAPTFVNAFGESPTSALPATGLINSVNTTGLTFQLAPYNQKNSLRLTTPGADTLYFDQPTRASALYLLVGSGNGASTFDATLLFDDFTSQTFPALTADDWFNGPNYAIQGVSRVNYDTDVLENSVINPRLYEIRLALTAANQSKRVVGVVIEKTSQLATLNVMAVSAYALPTGLPAERTRVTLAALPNPTTGTLTVQVPDAPAGAAVQLLDLTGRVILTAPIRAEAAQLDLRGLPAAVYVAHYRDAQRGGAVRVLKQ